MCLTEGVDGAKAASIFVSTEENFNKDELPWENYVKCYNKSAMVGKCNSTASRSIQKISETFICGCPYHLAHISASHANDAVTETLKLNVKNFCINLFNWFEKSSKHNGKLKELTFIIRNINAKPFFVLQCLSPLEPFWFIFPARSMIQQGQFMVQITGSGKGCR